MSVLYFLSFQIAGKPGTINDKCKQNNDIKITREDILRHYSLATSKDLRHWSKTGIVISTCFVLSPPEKQIIMKRIIAFVTIVILSIPVFAQKTSVSGVVLDSLTREGESSAVIQFYLANDLSKAAAFTTTDEKGHFEQSFTVKGDYIFVFDNMGRKVIRRPFTVKGQEVIDLGEILVQDSAEILKAGKATAMRPLVKMEVDKMTYNVEDDVDSKTSTVLDMLRKVPMVTVDGQDNIKVNGSSSFQVYVDGKPNQMLTQNASTVFKMMPASIVKNIEVVTNPGVKYDAEGVGGVLNITTNKDLTGGSSVSDGYYGTVMAIGSNRGGGAGVSASLQKGKFAMSLNANGMYSYVRGTETDIERAQDNGVSMKTHTESDMKMPMAMVNGSASYEIDSLNLVSATLGVMHFGMGNESDLTSSIVTAPGAAAVSYDGTTSSVNNRTSISFGTDYQHLWANVPKRSIVISYQFNGAPSVNNSKNTFGGVSIPGFNLTDRRSDGDLGSYDHTAQFDFTTPIGEKHTISTGAKFLSRHNSSRQTDYLWNGTSFVENPLASLKYDFYNRIGAAYTELEGKYGAFGIKAGVRYEYTWQKYSATNIKQFRVNYGNVVPSASLQWSPSMSQNLGISYNMRISRPGISYLNPYVDITDPTALSYGNTELKTERGHNVSLVYNFYSQFLILNATLRYNYTGNGISAYSFYDDKNLLNTTYGNIVHNQSTGLNVFMMVTPGSKTRIIINGGANYLDLKSKRLDQSNSGWAYNIMAGIQQTLPWDLRLSANIISMGRQITLQGSSEGMSMAVLGLTKSFLNDRLSLSANGMMPFAKNFKMKMGSTSSGNGFTTSTLTTIPMAQIMFQASWSFGKQGNYTTKKARRSIENENQLNTSTTAESMGNMMKF